MLGLGSKISLLIFGNNDMSYNFAVSKHHFVAQFLC